MLKKTQKTPQNKQTPKHLQNPNPSQQTAYQTQKKHIFCFQNTSVKIVVAVVSLQTIDIHGPD